MTHARSGSDDGSRRPLEALLATLGTSREGLSANEAARRLARSGAMDPSTARLRWRMLEFLRASANPLVIILLVAGVASAILGEVTSALIIGGIVVLSAGINFWQAFRSERAVMRLQAQVAPTATVRRGGAWVERPRREMVAGDVILLTAGDLVPADARLIESTDLHAQQAALTGESLPAEKSATSDALAVGGPESPALVFLGTSIVSGSARAVVFAAGMDTAFGDIVERLAARPEETEFERGARHFGVLILETVIFLVLFILVVNVSLGRNALESLLFSVALAVGLTPEFLPMITTVTLGQGAIRMAREKVIVKHLASIQNLGSIDVLCSDKTGTLTAGTMTLAASLDPTGAPSDRPLGLASLNAKFESGIKSPLDAAILERASPSDVVGCTKLDEVPFDFERRRLSVVVEKGGVVMLVTKGAPEAVLCVCTSYEAADGSIAPLDEPTTARCLDVFRSMSERGFRVLAVAHRAMAARGAVTASDECELTFAGFLTFADPVLAGTKESIERLRRDGVDVKLLTGDNELVTRHVCEQVGIAADRIVLGAELERLDDAALAHIAERTSVFARVSPAQKHRIIRGLRARRHVVGFLGDGINDAPSLHGADVGISVAGAADVAREASDIILLERRLDVLHAGIIAGRRAFGNVFKYLLMGTSSNFGNMFSMAGAALFLPFLPMLPTQILLNNLLYDVAQLTIPTDNVDATFIARPQRWDISVIRRFMLFIGPVSSIFDFLTFAALLWIFRFGEAAFHTAWFVESLATQVLVLFVIRTTGRPWSNPPSVPLVVTALLVVLVGVVLPYTPLSTPLGMVPLPPAYLVFVALVVPSYLALVELLKSRLLRRILPAAGSLAVALMSSCSNGRDGWRDTVPRRLTYDRAVASIARRQSVDDSVALPGARSILLTRGEPAPRAILLLHGLTDSPRQLEAFAYLLHAGGNNVYVPRLPQHGLLGSDPSALGALTADQLRGVADSVVADAGGLGDTVIVLGLSMGGTIAAWIGQHRVVGRVVLVAPAIEPGRIPSLFERPIIGLATRLPSMTRRSAPDTARPDREVGFNTRAVAAILSLGRSVLGEASREAPRTREIAVLVNASDRTVKASAAEALAQAWAQHGASVAVFEVPDSLRLPHNIIDPLRRRVGGDTVFALLRALTYGQQPSPWVRRLAAGDPRSLSPAASTSTSATGTGIRPR